MASRPTSTNASRSRCTGAARLSFAEEAADKERLARERLEFLTSLNDASLATSDHRQFMEVVTARAVPRLGDWCVIHFVGEPGSDPIVRAAHSDPSKMRAINDATRIDRHELRQILDLLQLTSVITADGLLALDQRTDDMVLVVLRLASGS